MRIGLIAALMCAALFAQAPSGAAELLGGAGAHRVKITKSGDGPVSETLLLPLHKAVIVELPVDAEDVLVTTPEIADVVIRNPRRVYVLGMQAGETNAFFFDSAGRQLLNLEIRVQRAVGEVQDAIDRLLPDARVKVESLGDSVVLSGTVPSSSAADRAVSIASRFVGDAEKVLNLVSITGKEQVLLKVRVVEMQRTVIKQLGLDITDLQARFTDELVVG
ncbi:MAG: pilus assembly protein N-terminal domain-containing protein, partial [Caulobacterales bacterium]|nr:pilus assembly protein N-terminal domain-containing protein [Caulobacterales bacterium]